MGYETKNVKKKLHQKRISGQLVTCEGPFIGGLGKQGPREVVFVCYFILVSCWMGQEINRSSGFG